jgi:hypothetical protein
MLFTQISTSSIIHILSFCDNITGVNIINSCKFFNNHSKKHGFATKITANYCTDSIVFIHRCILHSMTTSTIHVDGYENPHLWVPMFKENMIFTHCSFPSRIFNRHDCYVTKYLKITDYHRYKNKLILRIDWDMFPNLEELVLYVFDVDLNHIKNCTKLKSCNIDTLNKNKITIENLLKG